MLSLKNKFDEKILATKKREKFITNVLTIEYFL